MIPEGVMRFDTPPARLRGIAFLEGGSYLLLLFVAMPLKYFAGQPWAVRVTGLAHGILFILLALATLQAIRKRGKTMGWGARIGIAALIPFGTFALDRSLAADDEQYRAELARRGSKSG